MPVVSSCRPSPDALGAALLVALLAGSQASAAQSRDEQALVPGTGTGTHVLPLVGADVVIDDFIDDAFNIMGGGVSVACSAVGGLRSVSAQKSNPFVVDTVIDLVEGEGHVDIAVGSDPDFILFGYGSPGGGPGVDLDLDCDGAGDLETAWARIDSAGVFLPGGAPLIDGATGLPVTGGALLGCLTAGPGSLIDGGRLLWESHEPQSNGEFNSQ